MEASTVRRAGTFLAVAGALAAAQAALGLYHASSGWEMPHWIWHIMFAPMPWCFALAAWTLWRARGGDLVVAAAGLLALWGLCDSVITVAAVAWEGVLGHESIGDGLHMLEAGLFAGYAGGAALAVALWRCRDLPRWAGPVFLAGLVLDMVVPMGAGVGALLAGVALLRHRVPAAATVTA